MRSFSIMVNSFFSMSLMPVVFLVGTFLFPQIVLLDAPLPWQIGFQDPATPIAQGELIAKAFFSLDRFLKCKSENSGLVF